MCSSCGQIICKDHARASRGIVFCTTCAEKKTPESLKLIKSSIVALVVIIIFIISVGFVIDYYIKEMSPTVAPELFYVILSLFKTGQTYLLGGVGFILFILIIAYLVLRKNI